MDEVAAEHVGADFIVHYGCACLSPSKRLPLMYVFEKRPVDLEKCTSAFRELYPDTQGHIIIIYDVNYAHAIGKLSYEDFTLLPDVLNGIRPMHKDGNVLLSSQLTNHLLFVSVVSILSLKYQPVSYII